MTFQKVKNKNLIKYLHFKTGRDNSKCITLDKVCNGFKDCPDKSDEKGCFIECRRGSRHHFQCRDGKGHLINKKVHTIIIITYWQD